MHAWADHGSTRGGGPALRCFGTTKQTVGGVSQRGHRCDTEGAAKKDALHELNPKFDRASDAIPTRLYCAAPCSGIVCFISTITRMSYMDYPNWKADLEKLSPMEREQIERMEQVLAVASPVKERR